MKYLSDLAKSLQPYVPENSRKKDIYQTEYQRNPYPPSPRVIQALGMQPHKAVSPPETMSRECIGKFTVWIKAWCIR